jgi:hypothetical protein
MKHISLLITLIIANITFSNGAEINLRSARIIVSESIKSPMRETIVSILQEEIQERTTIKLAETTSWSGSNPVIAVVFASDAQLIDVNTPVRKGGDLPEGKAEGFRIVSNKVDGKNTLWLIGADERGVIYAIGQFLRIADMSKKKLLFDDGYELATSPEYAIRGHQFGYRDRANSWDAWSVEEFDKHFREMALFGANCIENIPFEDKRNGYHMKVDRAEMNNKMGDICEKYGMDYWVWTPAEVDLSDKAKFDAEIKRHSKFYKGCTNLDNVFFPGGDPGHNHPKFVMPFLEQISIELKKYHPEAGVWISLQGFSDEQVDYFYWYLDEYSPDWLKGVASGPSSPEMAETRFRLPKKYMHRHYPDVTHTIRCQYPVDRWDQAYALTLGRECTNPQPYFYAKIHNKYAPFTDGFLTYSDGVHDDVNKIIWSIMGWDTEHDVRDAVVQYCRFFFGSDVAEEAADGILALERNWVGPLAENGGVETTLAYWKNLEKNNPVLAKNWRWQQLVMRAYYDTYTKRRLSFEQKLEKEANSILANAVILGTDKAMADALAHIQKADAEPIAQDLRNKIIQYCDDLYESIRLQTSVPKYHASAPERGCILDFVDYPLNNRWWLEDEFKKISAMGSEEEKLERLKVIRTWEKPEKGSYYDNISDISKGPRVIGMTDDATDFVWWDNGYSRKRLSTQLYQNFPEIEYADLDPNSRYILRVAGYGDALVRVDGVRIEPSLYNKELEAFKEFHIARKHLQDGKIKITFDKPEESHLNWRELSKVTDVWLLKK